MKYEEEFRKYLSEVKGASDNTQNAYISDIKDFSAFCEEKGKAAETAGKADVADYVLKLKGENKSSSTVNRRMSSVRKYCSFLLEKGYSQTDPSSGIRSPKMSERTVEFLTVDQVNALLDIEGDDPRTARDRALLELLYATGMRSSEAAALNVSDVDLNIGFAICSTGTKSRMIPIGKPALRALEVYLSGARDSLCGNDRNASALFVNFQGQRITRQGIWKILKSYGEKAGIETEVSPQLLRNSFAVHMLQNGADLRSLQELMGLEDLNAAKLYLSVTKNRIMDVYDRAHPRATE